MMRNLILTLLSATTFALLAPLTLRADDSRFPAPLNTLELADGDSIVFLGDSITHQRLYTQYVETYFYTRMPHLRLKLHNAGVGGARAWDALARFGEDVAAYKPKYVTILLGMNDGSYRPYDEAIFQTYRNDMTELLDRIDAIGAIAIPMTPTMFDARARRIKQPNADPEPITLYNSVLAYYGTWLRDVAQQRGLGFVDMWSPLNNITLEQRKTDPTFTMIADAVHPGPAGQLVMATAIITDLNLPRQVSNIVITHPDFGEARPRTAGGTLSDLKATSDSIEFTWKAESLPWVVPQEAQPGAKLNRMGHRLSRESLAIHGLPPGRYSLSIDGTEVGTYTASALARHIELQSNEKTPQYQQALKVAELNKARNEGPIGRLRTEWSKFQRFARLQRTVEQQPDNEQARKDLENLTAQVADRAGRIDQANAEAKALEDQIFEINQPQPRKYVIKRVK